MHRKFGIASSHSTALPSLFFFPCVTMFSCFNTTGCEAYSFATDEYGIFNKRTNLGACRTHERGVGGGGWVLGSCRHKQVCTRVDSGGQKKVFLILPCPAKGWNPGSSDLISDSLTTELRHKCTRNSSCFPRGK